ncbi:MAG: hypothetical protein J3K34DRAFT_382742 [Monoraphidium minutum]|nr:MAG: hypothetical protein J3K34DRAFT_382742 [Monoraphidium minutum]
MARQRAGAAPQGERPSSAAACAPESTGAAGPHSQQPEQQQHKQAGGSGGGEALPFDERGPLVFAVGRLGPRYWDWVERPVPSKPRFFRRDAFEACSKTAWWVVPLIWLPPPPAAAAWWPGPRGGAARGASAAPLLAAAPRLAALLAAGALLWQLLEYCIHRFAFHARGDGYWAITVHFLFHGCHHKFPLDGERLVFPPLPAAAIAAAIYASIRAALPPGCALGLMSGVLLGYVAYDVTHYALHHGGKLPGSYLRSLRLRHAHHHYQDGSRGYQISSTLFDRVFGTAMAVAPCGGGGGGGGARRRGGG